MFTVTVYILQKQTNELWLNHFYISSPKKLKLKTRIVTYRNKKLQTMTNQVIFDHILIYLFA